jgi:hypothetical protein
MGSFIQKFSEGIMRSLLCKGALTLVLVTGCQTAQQAREIKLVGFEDNVGKGKSVGPMEGSDCVYHILGYWLGGQPTLSRAVMNARKGKHASLSDSFGGEGAGSGAGAGVRYFNNMTVSNDGFNAGVFGKTCINITAMGFK